VRAAFLAPILDEAGEVLSVLLFVSPASFRANGFLAQVAEILSRNLSLYLQRKAAERRLTHQSLHDALTGLPNRVFLTHQLEARLARNEPAAVLYIDLDRFKIINDTLGHSVGDQVLIEVASRLTNSIRPQDVAGRIGGDEFILLLTEIADRAEIERIARRVLAALEKPLVLMNRAYFLSGSIGVAIAPDDGRDAKLLIKCADTAMYRVKSEGRNDVRFFAGDMSDERTEQLQLASELPLAMQRGEVDLHYQPILDVADRRVVGFEALLRWRHPTRGMLLPEKFLPMAEQSNLIREVGMWAIQRAMDDRVELGLDRYDDAAVSVNVSARQLGEEGFLETLARLLTERNMPARLLRLELTESAFIEHPERTVALISELRRLGVRVIIDNFGTGYASLSYLKDLPVDGLKIDQVFVRDLPADRGNAAIIQAITTLAGKLGLQAMAEGVETAAELRALRSFDCDQMQGTLISEPLPFALLRDFLESLPEVRRMHLVRDGGAAA
jgi:diguanylate cyclase (GGDEF)-like protein